MTDTEMIINYLKSLSFAELETIINIGGDLLEQKENAERRTALTEALNSMNNFIQKYGALYLAFNGINIEITDKAVFDIPSDDLDTISVYDSSKKT